MTALDRTFIKAFRRRETESDCPRPTEQVSGEFAAEGAPPLVDSDSEIDSKPDADVVPLTTTSPDWQWPAICDELLRGATEGFESVAAELEALAACGKKSLVALAGSQTGVGCTSVYLTLARTLAARAAQPVLLIEANRSRPALCDQLQVVGPEVRSPRKLGESGLAIVSLDDAAAEISNLVARLADEYPLILIDAGCIADPMDAPALWAAGVVGTTILVDFDDRESGQRNVVVESLAKKSDMFLGVIETHREDLGAEIASPRMMG
ncbi:hypothetical protein CA54_25220 [Symmachiella macrocystis]|uniref:Uncharacterized protein n=1 Tax=Symmachiella macrocystis TaxID=2527985 RepID=A0A5C6BPN9_9PLAN|nr:hypothetical protein [Symmachiella macrocystis]TWU13687.1 hypothetical protein CA54_25220 [Symmachiella macrocystis]